MNEFNVFSCFDGISCGQQALVNAGIPYTKYYASEIDQRAVVVTQKRWPKTIQYGDITKIHKHHFMSDINLLIGGSPCQGFSFAGKQLNFKDPRSKLFFEFIRLKKELNPQYFFLENVKMIKESKKVITDLLEVEPVFVNSSLVSAQNRQRLYWTNIPGFTMPEDRQIYLKDILEFDVQGYVHDFRNGIHKYRPIEKAASLDASYYKGIDNHQARTCVMMKTQRSELGKKNRSAHMKNGRDYSSWNEREFVERADDKANCLTANVGKEQIVKIGDKYRMLTVTECERLQGLPDGYTKGISKSAAYHALGNGWQVDTIMEFFKNITIGAAGNEIQKLTA